METIKIEMDGTVMKITLNRPEIFNSFNKEMATALQNAIDGAASDKKVRAIYLTGEGKAFCAGQDLGEAIDENGPGIESIVKDHYNPIVRKIRAIKKPVVCVVNGVAAGAGANIALACDVVVAAKSASFIQAFSKIGLIPDSGGTFFLPRLIGMGKASALMMLGDKVMAEDAAKMGMIYKCVEDENLHIEAMVVAKKLAELPTIGIGLTKKLLNNSCFTNLENQLISEAHEQVKAAKSEDYKEGVSAFLEKRKPVFKGE